MLKPKQRNNRLTKPSKQHRPEKRPGNGAGEGEVVVRAGETSVDVFGRGAVDEDVVRGLEVEGFLDFGVW